MIGFDLRVLPPEACKFAEPPPADEGQQLDERQIRILVEAGLTEALRQQAQTEGTTP